MRYSASPGLRRLLRSILLSHVRNWGCCWRKWDGNGRAPNGPGPGPPTCRLAPSGCLWLLRKPLQRVLIGRVEMSAMTSTPFSVRPGGVLIASANRALRQQVLDRLSGRCRPVQALGGADALAKLEKGDWQVLFLDRH